MAQCKRVTDDTHISQPAIVTKTSFLRMLGEWAQVDKAFRKPIKWCPAGKWGTAL